MELLLKQALVIGLCLGLFSCGGGSDSAEAEENPQPHVSVLRSVVPASAELPFVREWIKAAGAGQTISKNVTLTPSQQWEPFAALQLYDQNATVYLQDYAQLLWQERSLDHWWQAAFSIPSEPLQIAYDGQAIVHTYTQSSCPERSDLWLRSYDVVNAQANDTLLETAVPNPETCQYNKHFQAQAVTGNSSEVLLAWTEQQLSVYGNAQIRTARWSAKTHQFTEQQQFTVSGLFCPQADCALQLKLIADPDLQTAQLWITNDYYQYNVAYSAFYHQNRGGWQTINPAYLVSGELSVARVLADGSGVALLHTSAALDESLSKDTFTVVTTQDTLTMVNQSTSLERKTDDMNNPGLGQVLDDGSLLYVGVVSNRVDLGVKEFANRSLYAYLLHYRPDSGWRSPVQLTHEGGWPTAVVADAASGQACVVWRYPGYQFRRYEDQYYASSYDLAQGQVYSVVQLRESLLAQHQAQQLKYTYGSLLLRSQTGAVLAAIPWLE